MVATPRVLAVAQITAKPWSAWEDAASGVEERGGYEEYHPFGTTSWHAAPLATTARLKRYKFTAKEKDEYTGLYYHGARYYACWLGRWISADPAGMVDGPNRYAYVRNNPVGGRDPTGLARVDFQMRPFQEAPGWGTSSPSSTSRPATATTVFLGGAGYESETSQYAPILTRTFEKAGMKGPVEYVPISHRLGGQVSNIQATLTFRGAQSSMGPSETARISSTVEAAFAPDAPEHNIIGYSYGTVIGAQTALRMADSGVDVDSLVLIGSPIGPESDLAASLEAHPGIGEVVWVDIPGDPFSGGVDLRRLPSMERHFAFIGEPETGQPTAWQEELAREVVGVLSGPDQGSVRLQVPRDLLDPTDPLEHGLVR